jgi:hypothetical protein
MAIEGSSNSKIEHKQKYAEKGNHQSTNHVKYGSNEEDQIRHNAQGSL